MKYCSKCGKTKPRSAFHKDRTKKDGLHWCCKNCKNAYSRQLNKVKKYWSETGKEFPYYDRKQTYLDIECGFCGRELNQGYIVGNYQGQAICRDCLVKNECIDEMDVDDATYEQWEKYKRKCKLCGEVLYEGSHKDGTCNKCLSEKGRKSITEFLGLG